MELGKIIAFNLKKLRTDRNLTLGQLSKISGISKAMLSDIEKETAIRQLILYGRLRMV